MPDTALIERFAAIVGEKNALTAPEDIAAYLIEQRDLYHGARHWCCAPVRPKRLRRS